LEINDLSFLNDIEYKKLLSELKEKVRSNQLKASFKVNYELLDLYWNLGKEIVTRQEKYSWGDAFIKSLSKDLRKEFPDLQGFSETNLKYMRRFYIFYEKSQQAVDQLEYIFSIPWGHHILLMTKCKSLAVTLFYIDKTIKNGWSRSVLEHQIDSNLYERIGHAITNFEQRLPDFQSDLAKQTLKDPYNFDFLTITNEYNERELQKELVEKISEFLLELGDGFAYVGKEYKLNINGDNFYIDLLFYHIKLQAYVVVELKTEKFKPEHLGQLNFYVTAINKNIKTNRDNETIGLLICKDKNDVVAEYSLESISLPIGISKYEIKNIFNEEYKSSLPSIKEIEEGIKAIDGENVSHPNK